MFVKRCLNTGLDRIADWALLEIHAICNELYLHVLTDATDSHKFFPHSMVTDAINTWEDRIDITSSEIKRRSLA
jgi:hypothetical protein